MSITAMNWAWGLSLSLIQKLVLMALADAADDEGMCWPSVATISRKCCVSRRTVQRTLQTLVDSDLLHAEPRFRGDRSRSSNRYRLSLVGGDNLSPPHDNPDTGPVTPVSPGGDPCVTPRTTIRTIIESPLQPGTDKCSVETNEQSSDCHVGCGGETELILPKTLSTEERERAVDLLKTFDRVLRQQLLDELAGRMSRSGIRVAPLSYLRGLVNAAERGAFTPEVALQVAAERRRAHAHAQVLAQLEARSIGPPRDGQVREDSPLAKRLLEIRDRVSQRPSK